MHSVIFDFNGTLFQDSEKHMAAWHVFADRYGKRVTREELEKFFLGRANAFILRRMFGEGMSEAEIARMAQEKEGIYRELCVADPANCHLVAGAEEFLDYLHAAGVHFTIATGSECSNVDFYFRIFGLSRWFDREEIVLDTAPFPASRSRTDFYLRQSACVRRRGSALYLRIPIPACRRQGRQGSPGSPSSAKKPRNGMRKTASPCSA